MPAVHMSHRNYEETLDAVSEGLPSFSAADLTEMQKELGHSKCHVGDSCRGSVKVGGRKSSEKSEVFREVVFEVALKTGQNSC